jgi:serine phosphatase RsbU (regulator of sigma subunit)
VRDAILADVQRFTRDAVQADDMALVVLVRE